MIHNILYKQLHLYKVIFYLIISKLFFCCKMRSCFIFSPEIQTNSLSCSSLSLQFPSQIPPEASITLPVLLETIMVDTSHQILASTTTYDYSNWAKIPQVISQKKRNSFENLALYKQILSKSKIFKSEFSNQLYQSISLGKNQIIFLEFKRFYEELDQLVNAQRFFHYFNKCNEFVLAKENFDKHFTEFIKLFKKLLKSSNLILECLMKRNSKLEDLKKDYLFLDYIKMINDFKNSINRNNVSSLFEGQETKIDKKKFLSTVNNCKTFPLMYLFEFLRLEKIAINFFLKEKSKVNPENKLKSTLKKFIMNEIKKNLKRCELNGDPSCYCSFCKW